MILLLAGRDGCAECDYMHNTVCESAEPPVKALILEAYVPWFCNIDLSDEWRPYAADEEQHIVDGAVVLGEFRHLVHHRQTSFRQYRQFLAHGT